MFYKPSDSDTESISTDSQSIHLHTPGEEREDSGVEMEFHSHSSLGTTQTSAMILGSISEMEEAEVTESGVVDSINGNFSKLRLQDEVSSPIHIRRKLSTTDIEQDSGLYESISSAAGGDISGHMSMENPDVTSSEHWMAVLSQRCYSTVDGLVDMDQIVSMFQGNQDGDNLLNLFIIHNLTEPAMFLIDHAPAPDWLDLNNILRQTPLHLAVITRQPEIVRRLVCAGASICEMDSNGNTPLHWACALGQEDIVHHLIDPVRDSDVMSDSWNYYRISEVPEEVYRIRNCEGDTCLHVAAREGHCNIVRFLLDHGCDPNIGDGKSGRTVLHHAAQAGHTELASLLLADRRTLCDVEDYGRHTPHDLARGQEKSGVMRLLIAHGANPTTTWGRKSSDSDSDSDDEDDFESSNTVIQNGHCSG